MISLLASTMVNDAMSALGKDDLRKAIICLANAIDALNGKDESKNTPEQSKAIVEEDASKSYAKLGAIMAVHAEAIWKRKCREVLLQMEKERPELKKQRIKWEKSHKDSDRV